MNALSRPLLALLLAVLVAACASTPPAPQPAAPSQVHDPAPFSTALALDILPPGWKPYRLARFKKPTKYQLVPLDGTVAMRAQADASASGLQFDLTVDVKEFPWLTWHWKVPELISGANNTIHQVEDSPARVLSLIHI